MNKLFLIGNVTHDIELGQTASGLPVVNFSLAVNRSYVDAEGERKTDFFRCTAWRGTAETVARNVKKGNKISVIGEIQFRNYEDNQGIRRTAADVIVESVEFLTPKSNGGDLGIPEPPSYMGKSLDDKDKPKLESMDDDADIPF